ncbi:MAG: methylated-DNA--[protein]-cysteine S-methyltransferase [Desulfarculus sp.]|nr:MAG: methylated-DNA--[protein]-cysteine S-methyltransferase [Desulfarculus sp.]
MRAEDFERVERAIGFIERHAQGQPSLGEIAAAANLSEYNFQRLFRRFAGVSPKRFLQYLTAQYARELLQRSRPVLEAAFAAGLSSPSRLHDLTLNVYAMTPGQVAQRGQGLVIRHGLHPSPFGPCLLLLTERGVCGLAFAPPGGRARALAHLAGRWPGATLRQDQTGTRPVVERIFAPVPAGRDQPLNLLVRGTNFQIQVWEALLRIPPAAAATYGELARWLGRPGAARAVGAANGANPIAYLIPCHRVIRGSGALGGYRWGLARKRALLAWESARNEGRGGLAGPERDA